MSLLIYINLAVDGVNQLFQGMQIIKFDSLKGLPHQIITAGSDIDQKTLAWTCYSRYENFFKLSLYFLMGL
jgi:hypothetical protein